MRLLLFCRGCFRYTTLFTPDHASLPLYILAVQFLKAHTKLITGWDSTVIVTEDRNTLTLRPEARHVWGDHEACSFTDNFADALLHEYCPRCLLCRRCQKCSCPKEGL